MKAEAKVQKWVKKMNKYITETKITVKELCQGYHDDGDGGVTGYDGVLI